MKMETASFKMIFMLFYENEISFCKMLKSPINYLLNLENFFVTFVFYILFLFNGQNCNQKKIQVWFENKLYIIFV